VFFKINWFLKVFDIESECRGYGSEVANPFVSWKYRNLYILQKWLQDQWNCFIISFSRVSKHPQGRTAAKYYNPILHITQIWNHRSVNPGTALKCHLVLNMKPWIATLLCHPKHWKNLIIQMAEFVTQALNSIIS